MARIINNSLIARMIYSSHSRKSLIRINSSPCAKHEEGHLPKLRPANLPSSLNLLLPLALGYSPSPPVSVCGTVLIVSCLRQAGSSRHFSWKLKSPKLPSLAVGLPITTQSHPDGFSCQDFFAA